MSGCINGGQAKPKAECPESLYVHCGNHALDLTTQEAARQVRLIADVLHFVQGVTVVIRESSKCKSLFLSLFGPEKVVCNIFTLCPNQQYIRINTISQVISTYMMHLETLKALEQDKTMRNET